MTHQFHATQSGTDFNLFAGGILFGHLRDAEVMHVFESSPRSPDLDDAINKRLQGDDSLRQMLTAVRGGYIEDQDRREYNEPHIPDEDGEIAYETMVSNSPAGQEARREMEDDDAKWGNPYDPDGDCYHGRVDGMTPDDAGRAESTQRFDDVPCAHKWVGEGEVGNAETGPMGSLDCTRCGQHAAW